MGSGRVASGPMKMVRHQALTYFSRSRSLPRWGIKRAWPASWTLPARCRVSCGRGLNEFPVYTMQPAVKDVDWDAPWLAWCGHPAILPFT